MAKTIVLFFLFMFIIPAVSSKIIFEDQFDEFYSFGDMIFVNFSVEKQISASDYAETFLECDGKALSVYKKYSKIEPGKNYFVFEFPASLKGDCSIEIKFDNEVGNREEFKISDEIVIDYNLNNKFFFPLEQIIINGTAIKKNGEPLDGVVFVSIQELENKTVEAKDGKFFAVVEIKKEAFPKNYSVQIEAIEKNTREEIINYGKVTEKIEIKSKSTYIEIESDESIKPPANISISARLLDQAQNLMENETLIIKLFNSDRDMILERSLKSNGTIFYFFDDNATRGGWEVDAYYGSVYSVKPIYIEENKNLSIELLNGSSGSYLRIRNIGNIGYEGVIKVFAENESHSEELLINLDLEVGGGLDYSINFEGYHNLNIEGKKFDNVYLTKITGAAAASKMKLSMRSYLFSFILIFCLVTFYFLFRKQKPSAQGRKESRQKQAYMVFFKFDKYFEEAEKLAKSYHLSLSKLSENLYFILFYSYPEENQDSKICKLAKKIMEKANSKDYKTSIVINSCEFVNRGSFLKKFALINRKLVEFGSGIFVTKRVFSKLGVPYKWKEFFQFDGEVIELYGL